MEKRIERLEKRNRVLTASLVAAVAVFICAGAYQGRIGNFASITTQYLEVADADGVVRMRMTASKEGDAGMVMFGKDGKSIPYVLIISKDGILQQSFSDQDGNERIRLLIDKESDATVKLSPPKGEASTVLSALKNGLVGWFAIDGKGKIAEQIFAQ